MFEVLLRYTVAMSGWQMKNIKWQNERHEVREKALGVIVTQEGDS